MLRPFLATLLLVATPVLAQPGPLSTGPGAPLPETAAQARCRDLLPAEMESRPGVEALGDGGCRLMFTVQPSWSDLAPVLPGQPRSYESGLIDVTVQDISPGTRVEHLADVPTQRARFLKLWQNSTVDQFNLSADFDLAPLTASTTDEASRLGLQALGPLSAADMAKGYRLFADGPAANLSVIMMCQAHLSCQLWWMQDEAAVEVTFTERFLPGWASMRSSVAAFLTHMRER